MIHQLQRLWNEDDAFVLSTETLLYGSVGVLGVTAGYTQLRDGINSELNDVAKAIGSIDQSYWFAPVVGHSAWTAGSCFYDRADYCDAQQQLLPATVEAVPGDRPLVCADVFGRGAQVHTSVPQVQPLPGPDSLRGRGAAVEVQGDVLPQPSGVRAVLPEANKGVVIGDPSPACVVGSPGLVPAPHAALGQGAPVNVMVNPWQAGPYLIDVPEGYFNKLPQALPNPYYRVYVDGRHGPRDFGYHYARTADRQTAGWDTIDLGFAKVGDDDLKHVEKFADAKCLHVLGSNVTDKGLAYIAEMDDLESLHLVGTQITDAGLKHLTGLKKLRFLHLVGTKITDKGLATLAGVKHLEELDVRGTPVTDAGLVELQRALPALRVIR